MKLYYHICVLLIILISAPCMSKQITLAERAGYFFAPVTIAYSYNVLTRAIYHNFYNSEEIRKHYWHQQIPLIFGFQALTCFCWNKAFSRKKPKPEINPHIHVTIS